MSSLTVLVNYNGRWANSKYTNCESKLLLVSDKITLEELRNKVYKIVNVDINEYDIIMKVIYDAMKTAWPAEITNDDDLRAFIFENLSKSWKIPLCITLKRKVSSQGIGNNREAPQVDFEQDQFPMGTQAHDFKENEQFQDTEYQVENNTMDHLDGLHCDDMQFEEHLESDDYVFQNNACAVCRIRQISCYSMCSQYYNANALVAAYVEPVWPVGDKKDWVVPDDIRDIIVLPPATRRKYGRRKEKRLPSRGEVSATRKCSRCGLTGHYRQRCTNPVALHPTL